MPWKFPRSRAHRGTLGTTASNRNDLYVTASFDRYGMSITRVAEDLKFDANQIFAEYQRVKLQCRKFEGRLRITFSDMDDENAPPDHVCSPSLAMHDIMEEGSKPELVVQLLNTWQARNILKPWQGSYTQQVVAEIDAWVRTQGYRVSVAKFSEMLPGRCLGLHVDGYAFRYHVPVTTNKGAYMIIEDQLYRMPEVGVMYCLRSDVEHSAINAWVEPRVHMVIDVVKL